MDTAQFLSCISDDMKDEYARAMYKLLKKQDLAFRHFYSKLHLGKNDSDATDRFAFLFLCKKVFELKNDELAQQLYDLRMTGFRLTTSSRTGSVSIRPDTDKWNTAKDGEPNNGVERFKDAWVKVKQENRDWVKQVFSTMPYDFPEFVYNVPKKIA